MIDDLRALAIFAKVAEAGSFSAAGRSLRLSTSVVSHHVKALETRHGVSLFHRSTRSLSLTNEGQRLLQAARRMVEAAEEGFNAIAEISDDPTGMLRVSAPAFLMNSPQVDALWCFARRYPGVGVTLCSSDEQINLVAEGFDLAIRLGNMADSTLKSRKIGTFERVLVAAPSYLESIDPLSSPTDLARCDFVVLDMLPEKFVLQQGGKEVTVQPERSRVLSNSISGARSAVLAGLGMQKLPLSEVAEDLAAGRLVAVLPEWSLATFNIHAVWPESSRRGALVGLLLKDLVDVQNS
ncbi:LysR family transcriptional regulator [Granulosicoccus sp. 3-233]|uniref:LysR family transcriptional regulator n=1 Tax=Granulosicoccus sp. 3-233 TaxID=3417969 RepID=UPI003D344D45